MLDQFYKNPQLPLPSAEGVVARAIQLGCRKGRLGWRSSRRQARPGELALQCAAGLDAIDFSPDQVVLTRERAEAQAAQREAARRAAEQLAMGDTAEWGRRKVALARRARGWVALAGHRAYPTWDRDGTPRLRQGRLSPCKARDRRCAREQDRRRQPRHLPAAEQSR